MKAQWKIQSTLSCQRIHTEICQETFSPVVRFTSIRMLLAFVVQHSMLIHQMDVVAAFLNGSLQEDIYMEQPK